MNEDTVYIVQRWLGDVQAWQDVTKYETASSARVSAYEAHRATNNYYRVVARTFEEYEVMQVPCR